MFSKTKLAVFAFALLGGALYYAPPVSAESSMPDTSVPLTRRNTPYWANQDFYVYIKAGERVEFSLELLRVHNGTPVAGNGVDVQLFGENGYTGPVTRIDETDAIGTQYDFQGPVATEDSVWRLQIDRRNATTNVNMLGGWEGGAYDASDNIIPGRVFTYTYYLSQVSLVPGGGFISKDFSIYNITDDGYIYEARYLGFMGINSDITANNLGSVSNSCERLHKSYAYQQQYEPITQPAHTTSAACNDRDPIFFENPTAADLPASAEFDDGTVNRILPPISRIEVNNLAYTHNPGDVTMAGTITADVNNYTGSVNVRIDVDGNGIFYDAIDRTIPVNPDASGRIELDFDGLDGNGAAIPAYQRLVIRAVPSQMNETHFIRSDVERSAGGIEVSVLNGHEPGTVKLHWDDTLLTTIRCGTRNVSPAENLEGVDSAGGVHSWDNDNCVNPDGSNSHGNDYASTTNEEVQASSSWGNMRHIDDWTYRPFLSAATDTGPVPELHIDIAADKTVVADGSEIKYTLTVTNTGSATVPHIINKLPEQLSVISSQLPPDCQLTANNTVECIPGRSLEPGEILSYEIYTRFSAKSGEYSTRNIAHVYGLGDLACTDDQSDTGRCHSDVELMLSTELADAGDGSATIYALSGILLLTSYILYRVRAKA
ncbi:hypothetical protein CSA80_00810 [Candidatus Saccharibacteria bacterium]|nr:MAG: hypothetical protein CSA80_00810 [Candidatus Saccharibacteria bacterium]